MIEDEDMIEIIGPVETFKDIADGLHKAKVTPQEAGMRMVPKQEMDLSIDDTLQVIKVLDALEELDDVQDVFHNMKMSDEALAALEAE